MPEKKTCFVIAPIGEPDSETRKRSDQILKHVITPATNECGYAPIRADQISEPGLITSQVIQHIMDDPLVIADLTERNPNVFYELAIRHAIRRPLVQIIKTGETMPFDVAGTRTISVDHRDLDSVEAAKREIVRQIKAVEQNPTQIDSPISVSIDLQTLRQSENPEQRSLADILSAISELRSAVSSIEKRIGVGETYIPEPSRRRISLKKESDINAAALWAKLGFNARTKAEALEVMERYIKDNPVSMSEAELESLREVMSQMIERSYPS